MAEREAGCIAGKRHGPLHWGTDGIDRVRRLQCKRCGLILLVRPLA